MMNRSVCGGGPMAGQPGALENVKYMTTREFESARLSTAGQDVGNRNKACSLYAACYRALMSWSWVSRLGLVAMLWIQIWRFLPNPSPVPDADLITKMYIYFYNVGFLNSWCNVVDPDLEIFAGSIRQFRKLI
jgi:hypothetical protein